MAAADLLLHVWEEWGLQVLVLLSFTLQMVLLILAEHRRNLNSVLLRGFVWSAYMLADETAIYVLGHMSVTSRSAGHELIAFWAPFLLLHLGGQDNITAYAIEDNRLWLRHLQTLAVQVAAAAYVLYGSSILNGRWSLLWWATILIFAVGVVKYSERVWVLRRAGTTESSTNYRRLESRQYLSRLQSTAATKITDVMDTEAFLLMAHMLLHVPKDLLLERVSDGGLVTDLTYEEAYKVVEMQLSLMHDVFYTKAEVMHTWHGFCVRIISLLATAIALLLFHLSGDLVDSYSTLDVAVTYVLLVGAVVVEITSVVRVLFSSWTCALLVRWNNYESRARSIWYFLARLVVSVRRIVHATCWRRSSWSCSMGQHNLLRLCARSKTSRRSKIARWMGFEDWWNTLSYSWSIPVSACIEQLVLEELRKEGYKWRPDHIINSQGREALKRWGLYEKLEWTVEESIVVCHIATDLYIRWYKEEQQKATDQQDNEQARQQADLANSVEALSNYLLFLLAARPYMLPPSVNRNAYLQMCYALLNPKEALRCWRNLPSLEYSSAEDLAGLLRQLGNDFNTRSTEIPFATATVVKGRQDSTMLITGAQLGAKLISQDQSVGSSGDMLKLIVQQWAGMLLYVGSRCSAYSHAKQLSDGGDLTTVAALLVKYITGDMIRGRPQYDPDEHTSEECLGISCPV